MKKYYILAAILIIILVIYVDLIDSIKKVNNIISEMFQLDSAIKIETEYIKQEAKRQK